MILLFTTVFLQVPEFPYEKELAEELSSNIARFGGQAGAEIMKEHAIEILETSASSNLTAATAQSSSLSSADPNNSVLDNSDTMEELNRMISKFERLSRESGERRTSSGTGQAKSGGGGGPPHPAVFDRHRLNNAVRETFAHRFAHMFLSFEHFVIFGGGGSGSERDSAVDMGEEDEDDPGGTEQYCIFKCKSGNYCIVLSLFSRR